VPLSGEGCSLAAGLPRSALRSQNEGSLRPKNASSQRLRGSSWGKNWSTTDRGVQPVRWTVSQSHRQEARRGEGSSCLASQWPTVGQPKAYRRPTVL